MNLPAAISNYAMAFNYHPFSKRKRHWKICENKRLAIVSSAGLSDPVPPYSSASPPWVTTTIPTMFGWTIIAVTVFLVWLGVEIRQWIVFSKWSKKYRHYKELQKKVNESLDFDSKGTAKEPQ